MIDDVASAEAAEASIDAFISRRSASQEKANELEDLWKASEARHREERRRELAAEWREYHLARAEGLERIAARLAADHRARAAALSEERGATQ